MTDNLREELEALVAHLVERRRLHLRDMNRHIVKGNTYDARFHQGVYMGYGEVVDCLEAILARFDEKNASETLQTSGNGISEYYQGYVDGTIDAASIVYNDPTLTSHSIVTQLRDEADRIRRGGE